MANFKSWKTYMLFLIDRLVEEHDLKGPFLDAGCGAGDVSIHFAKRGWEGTAVDFSDDVVDLVKKEIEAYPHIKILHSDLAHISSEPVHTAFLMDVIEHVKDDVGLLNNLSKNIARGGHLIVTVPVNPREWRWDDAFYGHYRRYTRVELQALFENSGFEILSVWDCSFPLFWFMRRIYTKLFSRNEFDHLSPEERTKISTCQSAWDYSVLSSMIDWFFSVTRLALIHYPFRKGTWGCEVLLLARKK